MRDNANKKPNGEEEDEKTQKQHTYKIGILFTSYNGIHTQDLKIGSKRHRSVRTLWENLFAGQTNKLENRRNPFISWRTALTSDAS